MAENIVEQEEIWVTSIFSFYHNIFEDLLQNIIQTQDCVEKG